MKRLSFIVYLLFTLFTHYNCSLSPERQEYIENLKAENQNKKNENLLLRRENKVIKAENQDLNKANELYESEIRRLQSELSQSESRYLDDKKYWAELNKELAEQLELVRRNSDKNFKELVEKYQATQIKLRAKITKLKEEKEKQRITREEEASSINEKHIAEKHELQKQVDTLKGLVQEQESEIAELKTSLSELKSIQENSK